MAVDGVQARALGGPQELAEVAQLVAGGAERLQVPGRGLALPEAVGEQHVAAGADDLPQLLERLAGAAEGMRRAEAGGEGERLRLELPALGLGDLEPQLRGGRAPGGPLDRGHDLVRRGVDPHAGAAVALGDPDHQLAGAAAHVEHAVLRRQPREADDLVDRGRVQRVVEREIAVADRGDELPLTGLSARHVPRAAVRRRRLGAVATDTASGPP